MNCFFKFAVAIVLLGICISLTYGQTSNSEIANSQKCIDLQKEYAKAVAFYAELSKRKTTDKWTEQNKQDSLKGAVKDMYTTENKLILQGCKKGELKDLSSYYPPPIEAPKEEITSETNKGSTDIPDDIARVQSLDAKAAERLGYSADPRAIYPLSNGIEGSYSSSNKEFRTSCAEALGRLGSSGVIEPGSEYARYAIDSLMEGVSTGPTCPPDINDEGMNEAVQKELKMRIAAVKALGDIGIQDPDVIKRLNNYGDWGKYCPVPNDFKNACEEAVKKLNKNQ